MIISVRDAASIAQEPREHLQQWRIFTLANGDRHFCGVRANGTTVRVSSRIVMFDAADQSGMTSSGRIYQLEGPSGNLAHLGAAVAVWCIGRGVDPSEVEFIDAD